MNINNKHKNTCVFQKMREPYLGLMNKNIPMVCGGVYKGWHIFKQCYYLGKYDPTNRNVITLQRNTLHCE